MKKNIEWLKKELDDIENNTPALHRHDAIWMLDRVHELYDQLDEPIEDPLAEKIEERNNKPFKIISGEYLPNENDPIKPSHYRKGEIDLYESWYRTYPFNEFRAGMQMIAERYMKRDKNNRVEDLEKGIYTLERLKEYEEEEE